MQARLLCVLLPLIGASAASFDPVPLADLARSIGGVPLAVGLTNLAGMRAPATSMLLIVGRLQCAVLRDVARASAKSGRVVARTLAERYVAGSWSSVALRPNAAVAAFSLPLLARLLKWMVGAS